MQMYVQLEMRMRVCHIDNHSISSKQLCIFNEHRMQTLPFQMLAGKN